MAKLVLDNVGNLNSAGLTVLNNNSDRIEAAVENTLSRDGTSPNQMNADLDMNENDVLNADNIGASRIDVHELYVDDVQVVPGSNSLVDVSAIFSAISIDEDTQNSNLDTKLPTQQSVNAAKLQQVSTRSVMDTLNGLVHSVVYLFEEGREGVWRYRNSDLSSAILGTAIVSTSVDSGTDQITKTSHGLKDGNCVLVSTAVNGLSVNTKYYVIRIDADTFKLASTYTNAMSGTALDLTGTTNISVQKHNDPTEGVYRLPATDYSGASGGWQRVLDGGRLTLRMFGADPSLVLYSDEAIEGCIGFLRASLNSGTSFFQTWIDGEGLSFKHRWSINGTNIKGRGQAWVRTELLSEMLSGDEISVDLTGSQFMYLDEFLVRGDQTNPPKFGIVFARISNGGSPPHPTAAYNNLGQIECAGTFQALGFLNMASEVQHIDQLRVNNNYYSRLAACAGFAGNSDAVLNFCGLPTSRYQTIGTGSQSLEGVVIDDYNVQRNPAYGVTITSVTKGVNPTVTIAAADAANLAANFGLADGAKVFIDAPSGSEWITAIGYYTWTISSFNAAAGTFVLNGADTSAVVASWSTAILRNDTGPTTLLGQLGLFKEGGGYHASYSSRPYLLDPTGSGGLDWNWNIQLASRHETASAYLMEIKGNTSECIIRNLSIESDNSPARTSVIQTSGVSGGGRISLYNLRVTLGHAAQTPTNGMFNSPGVVNLYGGEIIVPTSSFTNAASAFASSSARWDYGGTIRQDGTVVNDEGSFVPVLTFATPGDLSVTYGNQIARYTKIGRTVTIQVNVTTTGFTHSTASGNMRITGLPFTAANSVPLSTGVVDYGGITNSTRPVTVAETVANQSYIEFRGCGSGVAPTNITPTQATSGSTMRLVFSLTYTI